MRKISIGLAMLMGAAALVACKGDSKTTTFTLQPGETIPFGYESGTPVTLSDGTPVTTPSGTPVTTPEVRDSKGKLVSNGRGSSGGSSNGGSNDNGGSNNGGSNDNGGSNNNGSNNGGSNNGSNNGGSNNGGSNNGSNNGGSNNGGSNNGGSNNGGSNNGGGPTTTEFVQPTGTTATTAPPNVFATFAFPKTGRYGFHESVNYDDPTLDSDADTFYNLTSPDGNKQIKWQRAKADGSSAEDQFYVEQHDSDGLWLVNSQLLGGGDCTWSPKAAEMPKSVVEKIGTTVTTDTSCTAPLNGSNVTFDLHTEVKALDFEQLLIGGTKYDCVKIERVRTLKAGKTKFETQAHDWYAFALGFRVKVSDHTTVTDADGKQSSSVRDLSLTSLA